MGAAACRSILQISIGIFIYKSMKIYIYGFVDFDAHA